MKFVYIGGRDSPEKVTAFGKSFSKNGEPVEVTGKNESKLLTNLHFKKVEEKEEALPVPETASIQRIKKYKTKKGM